jgi:hypothetical protein
LDTKIAPNRKGLYKAKADLRFGGLKPTLQPRI